MPEGDTVFRTARRLDEALAGSEVTRFDLRVPRFATLDLTGQRVHAVVPRGKHLLARIGDSTLHSHLRMDGAWFVYRHGEKWRHPAFKVRAIIGTADREAVGVDLAEIEVVPTRDEEQLVGYLGPDPLADDWDADEANRRLGADARSIHVALLDQRNVAGFGNEYAAELLFLRGILPTTPTPEVDVSALLDLGVRTIRANRDRRSRTFTGIDRPGQGTWVYGRAGRPCRRCGTLIRRGEQGADPTRERVTFWCPSCQR
ncbi:MULTISPECIES: DNA-formamidopyrimidine glycosylase family protein [Microbacterium]|uniref:DNA-(apurinic or apyrimidinic site) lyase n=1 Tax=Microbacterium aurugineum TaxID=2851642 RepID=A0ABY4IW54_9MICO|nr:MULTISPECIES: DNA-formamidopyrimidine glycosylase family protein [Microbacterium]PKQ33840.1 MAG: DNA glycosylase [Actinobacteria bacterium HGW-Actinobacteria-11]MCK8468575.1 Fpg/Nei family DNA glycosylase [Microbacterium aurugineum]MCZ4302347.1 Fpg/Nei family DNA glycosylase [Microbacterium oxydans]QEA27298.1 Fpg/Nei family DNA glycosylase [Microbacterium sp. CBA3102]TCJ23600.1 Fpg/Nei family DNA glycosylase [Microbacterium sp. PI-1]